MDNAQREILEVDFLFVGAGPASLAGALHLNNLLKETNSEPSIAIIEKGSEVGAHSLSGAIVDPRSLNELFPNLKNEDFPFESPVNKEYMYYFTKKSKISIPFIPKPMSHHGCYIASIGKLTRWLEQKCEQAGIDIFAGFSGSELIYHKDQKTVIGVRTGDRGIDKDGNQKPNFEPGVDIHAKITFLGEGSRGSLTKKLIRKFNLMDGKNPQNWAIGVKELWQLPEERLPSGYVAHTLGFPLGHSLFGGGFIYSMNNNILDLGVVVGLDYKNPSIDPHHELQLLKSHPWLQKILDGAEILAYGSKSLPEGGLYSLPKLYVNGAMLIGDSAGFLNGQRLKGIHLAMKSGMLAAETAKIALDANDFSEDLLKNYETSFNKSWAYEELYRVRNFHQGFKKGLIHGMANASIGLITGGRGFGLFNKLDAEDGHKQMKKGLKSFDKYDGINYDGKYILDKVTDVYYSATSHDEDQVPHLHIIDPSICIERCKEEFGNPCISFCPANVYEIVHDGQERLQINFSNCVHCKTCDIMDPYQIIDWITPEGGDGPSWKNM